MLDIFLYGILYLLKISNSSYKFQLLENCFSFYKKSISNESYWYCQIFHKIIWNAIKNSPKLKESENELFEYHQTQGNFINLIFL